MSLWRLNCAQILPLLKSNRVRGVNCCGWIIVAVSCSSRCVWVIYWVDVRCILLIGGSSFNVAVKRFFQVLSILILLSVNSSASQGLLISLSAHFEVNLVIRILQLILFCRHASWQRIQILKVAHIVILKIILYHHIPLLYELLFYLFFLCGFPLDAITHKSFFFLISHLV